VRLVRTLIHEDDRDGVIDVLESENIDYIVYREASGRSDLFVVEFPIPEQAVEVVFEKFDAAGHDEHAFTVVSDATSALSENMGESKSGSSSAKRRTAASPSRNSGRRRSASSRTRSPSTR
jgi:hypothetical protein